MRRICMLGLVGCFGVAALPQAAVAQIAPNPAIFSVSGHVTFVQVGGVALDCNLEMTIAVDPGGMTGVVTNAVVSPGDFLCALVVVPANLPWPVTRITPAIMGRFEISNVQLDGIGSQCNNGRIIVTWDNAGSGDLATNGVMPGYTPSVPYPSATCTVDGMVSQDSGPPISVS